MATFPTDVTDRTDRKNDMKLELGSPTLVAESVGHLWFPTMDIMPTGEWLVRCSAIPDTNDVPPVNSYVRSEDKGKTWSPLVLTPYIGPAAFVRGDELLNLPYRWYPANKDYTSLISHRVTFHKGAKTFTVEPETLHVDGFPRSIEPMGQGEAMFVMDNNIIRLADGRFVCCMYGTFRGDVQRHNKAHGKDGTAGYSLVFIESKDGASWRYVTTIADWSMLAHTPEGPDESTMVQLANGDLLVIYRVGSFKQNPLHKSLSRDGGRTWSKPEAMAPFSVYPSCVKTANGTLVLTTGRPGIYLWTCTDGRGDKWVQTDIMAYHNKAVSREDWRIESTDDGSRVQTTSYTRVREYAPNRVVMVYDRVPLGWHAVPNDSKDRNRLFVLPDDVN